MSMLSCRSARVSDDEGRRVRSRIVLGRILRQPCHGIAGGGSGHRSPPTRPRRRGFPMFDGGAHPTLPRGEALLPGLDRPHPASSSV
eukprot:4730537-Pyramimonas_sp.AAC.1